MALREFLKSHRTFTSNWTITGLSNDDKGKYNITETEYDTFLSLVHQHIFGPRPMASSLVEGHKENGPLLVDLDFRYEKTGAPLIRRFSHDDVQTFTAMYVAAMIYFARVEDLTEDLIFYYMVKPSPETDTNHHKDGVHIQCPTLSTCPKFQYAIRGFLLSKGIIGNVFEGQELSNSGEECFDHRVIHVANWFLYGACKPNKAQYSIINIWKVAIDDVREAVDGSDPLDFEELVASVMSMMTDVEVPSDKLEIMKTLSVRRPFYDTETELPIRECHKAEWDELQVQWGAGKAKSKAAMSVSAPASAPAPLTTNAPNTSEQDVADDASVLPTAITASEEDVKLAYRLCKEVINPERRAGEYEEWTNLAFCLKNIADTDASFEAWVDVTRRVDPVHKKASYSEAQLRAKWNLIRIGGARRPLTIASLIKWAEEDNRPKYDSIRSETTIDWIINGFFHNTHVRMAALVFRLYKYEFRCSVGAGRGKSYDLYQYLGHSWKKLRTSTELRERLSNQVLATVVEANGACGRRQNNATNDMEKKIYQAKRDMLYKVEHDLEMTTVKDHVLKECQEKFYNEDFGSRLDCDKWLIGVSNGVLDLNHFDNDNMTGRSHVHFRKGLPDDHISFQMGRMEPDMDPIPYIEYKASDPDQVALMEFFSLIYPDPELREYVLMLLASCLEGQNSQQLFFVNQGGGSNGKSMIQNLMEFTFGDYQTSLQTTVLTRKRPESGAANPDMITTKCKRYIYMGEPDAGEKLNTSRMKQLSGEDRIEARGLFSDQEKFNMMGKLFLSCNDLPPISSMDNGTWRRIRVIPHVSTFKDPGSPEIDPAKHIYEKDYELKSKLKQWRVAFLGLLVHYYETKYIPAGRQLKEPACVLIASKRYKESNDVFKTFFDETFMKQANGGPIRTARIKTLFREWKKRVGREIDMKDNQIIERMKAECAGNSTDKEFYGIVELTTVEDISGANMVE